MTEPKPASMTAVIMAGGRGERMRRSGSSRPKPLVELAGQPLVLHLARRLHEQGCRPIRIALGHHGDEIADDLARLAERHPELDLEWQDTGASTGNAGRLLKLGENLPQQTFLMCWCDGLSDLDLRAMLAFHRDHGRLATVAAVREPARFGVLDLDGDRVEAFREKNRNDQRWINGGYYILEPRVIAFIHDDSEAWETGPMRRLIEADQLRAYRHEGFWEALDTTADRDRLARRIEQEGLPWQTD